MRKIVIIFIIGMIISGCSVTKNRRTGNPGVTFSGNILENTEIQNISNYSFFIQKAEIEILTAEGKEKLIGTIKFEKPDKYLISIKSRTGIEGARIYITKDTILVNDRINKKLYSGTAGYLNIKYGINQSLLPLIFGDIILDSKSKNGTAVCTADKLNIDCPVKGALLRYIVDCNKAKTSRVTFVDQGINVNFDNYFVSGNILVPRIVEIRSAKYKTDINIKIVRVEYPWNGNVSFVSGKDYELIELR